jgi:hypothetical protein
METRLEVKMPAAQRGALRELANDLGMSSSDVARLCPARSESPAVFRCRDATVIKIILTPAFLVVQMILGGKMMIDFEGWGRRARRRAKWATLSVSDQCRRNFVFEWLP